MLNACYFIVCDDLGKVKKFFRLGVMFCYVPEHHYDHTPFYTLVYKYVSIGYDYSLVKWLIFVFLLKG